MVDVDVRGGSLTDKGLATRQRIVEVASDLMVNRGVAAVSLDEVGRATTTSKSQMYHYFKNKADLVEAVVVCVRARILRLHADLLKDASSVEDFRPWANAIVAFQRTSPQWSGCPLGTLASELVADPNYQSWGIRDSFDDWRLLLEATLVRLRETGALKRRADPERLAIATLASLQGGLLLSKALQSETPLVSALDAAIEHLREFSSGESMRGANR